MTKKSSLTSLMLLVIALAGCDSGSSSAPNSVALGFYDQIERGYDTDLFFKNGNSLKGADPGCIYISDKTDPNYGYFYIYPTSDFEFGCLGYVGYRTKDFNKFENCGAVFSPQSDSFSQTSFWAPEVIYDKDAPQNKYGLGEGNGVYYLFYTADDKYNEMIGSYYPQFLTHADKIDFENIRSNSKSYSLANCNTIIDRFRNGNVPDAKYNPYKEDIKYLIEDYDYEISNTTDESKKLQIAQDYFCRIYSSYIHKEDVINDFNVGVAVSTSPNGPFVQYTNSVATADARALTIKQPFMDAEDFFEYGHAKTNVLTTSEEGFATIDLNPYVDPVTNDKYLFFVRRHSYSGDTNFICGMKMGNLWTDDPKWDTLTRLTTVNYTTVGGSTKTDYESNKNTINEGPEMTYYEGKYYLTFSVDNLNTPNYSVGVAVCDDILGSYRKLQKEEGGLFLTVNEKRTSSGVGHHSFVKAEGEDICVYHAHWNPDVARDQRIIKADRFSWIKNNNDLYVPQINGPTTSVQPKFGSTAQYINIASEAQIKDDDNEDLSFLGDGIVPTVECVDFVKEYPSKNNSAKITITFEDYKNIKAILVYNSKSFTKTFNKINQIDIKAKTDGQEVNYQLNNIAFDQSYIHSDASYVTQCAAAIAEFDKIEAKEITIQINQDTDFAIGEIMVLGERA